MANFIIIIDPDRDRRRRFVELMRTLVAPVGGLRPGECATGDFAALWAAAARAPVSSSAGEDGAVLVWGDAYGNDGTGRVDAAEMRALWKGPEPGAYPVFDGFYAAAVYEPGGPHAGITLGADLLGIFPVYYFSDGELFLAGSSPELFRHHPVFRQELDPAGLVGILLTMHLVDGRTLLKGVRRLAPGHLLRWSPAAGPCEILHYRIPVSDRYFSLPFSAHLDILDTVLDDAVARHAPAGEAYALLLSGGLDSRMLAGYLGKHGAGVTALTLGISTDLEMACALPVARTLGFRHRAVDLPFTSYPAYAGLQAAWEHVGNGFNNIVNWGLSPHLQTTAQRVVMGNIMDAAVGGSSLTLAYTPADRSMRFGKYFAKVNAWGIRADVLKKLLRQDIFGDLVDGTIERIRAIYEGYGELESHRVWCFNLNHRQRFHVGSDAWALSFGAWPVLPMLDRAVIESAGGMPAATLAERRAQKELFCLRFPPLAQLPLDRNSLDTEPLRPRLRHHLTHYLSDRIEPVRRAWQGAAALKEKKAVERRYYVRIYDINSPGWLAVRRQAEPYRERVMQVFNREVLDELLPPPDAPVAVKEGISDVSGMKTLLGILHWSKDYLP
ncbi:MAG: asparagine synthase-related protein [Nitrospirota bacterium]